ncbi:helix-turn-helix domain-containing protein [Shinella sp. BYT-45]|uniref:helix-turn-helix domain-containing protein n=1 Tax=Shinella sp. BYT-45 TaxID=3377377 RepID=UPI00398055A8
MICRFVNDELSFYGMARPFKPRTALARRLIEAREKAGFSSREDFAALLGVPTDTLGTYERGVSEPKTELLAKYHEVTGLNLTWLITGIGEPFPLLDRATPSASGRSETLREVMDQERSTQEVTVGRIASLIEAVHEEYRVRLPTERKVALALRSYNRMIAEGADFGDSAELVARLEVLRIRLRKYLSNAVDEPGSGKHSA